VTIENADYRDLQGRFDKIASVGMFEHVGCSNMGGYFRKVLSLLDDGGRFLNRGIVRPENVSLDAATLFLQRRVFPGGELMHLADIVREAERAGFGVLEAEDFRKDYALTCRAWVSRLVQNEETCRVLVGKETYRTWLLYLAASAVSFEDGVTDAAQITLEKRPRQSGFKR
jgi:cyclopropane-fatty-acyl-phospholipid synthase